MGPFKILERIGKVAYKMELPTSINLFTTCSMYFHVSMLRKCISDRDNVVSEPPPDLRTNLTVEGRPVRVTGRKTKPEGRKNVKMIQVVWDCIGEEETTWEPEE